MKRPDSTREPARILRVKPLGRFTVELVFADGLTRIVNLKKYLHGPAFEQIRSDPEYFRQVFIDPIGETIMWPNTADIDTDVLRYDLTPSWMERQPRPKRSRKNGARKRTGELLVPKRVYLYPRQVSCQDRREPERGSSPRG